MSKYNRAFKINAAIRLSQASSRELGRELGVNSRQIRYWSEVYRLHGEEAFKHSYRPYTQRFKLGVIETMKSENWSLTYTSAFYDLSSPGILSGWLTRYTQLGSEGLISRQKGNKQMEKSLNSTQEKSPNKMSEEELINELEYLRAENAVLKKFKALAQEKKERTKKKR